MLSPADRGGRLGGTPDAGAGVGLPGVIPANCRAGATPSVHQSSSSRSSSSRTPMARGITNPSGVTVLGSLDVEEEEWARYIASLNILRLPEEAVAVPLLAEALAGAPVPSPWLLCRGPDCELFFANETTRSSSFQHPFHSSMVKLARICPTLLGLPLAPRRTLAKALREFWYQEAKQEFDMWLSARAEDGEEYFYHSETMAVMWESPADVVLPAHDLKLRAVERLEDDIYVMRVFADHRPEVRSSAALARERVGEQPSEHSQAVAELLSDECEWIRKAAAEALLRLTQGPNKSPSTTAESWFSAHSRVTVHSVP